MINMPSHAIAIKKGQTREKAVGSQEMGTFRCDSCGEEFFIVHDPASVDKKLAERQAKWLEKVLADEHERDKSEDQPECARRYLLGGVCLALVILFFCQGSAARLDEVNPPVGSGVKANSKFSADLYAKLRRQSGNLFFSPFSISAMLAMTYAGARGQTAEQLATVLHLPADQAKTQAGFGALIKGFHFGVQARGYQLDMANGLWTQKGYTFLRSFAETLRLDYGADVSEVDFSGDAEGARAGLNAWVENRTHGKIKDLFPPGALESQTRLVLADAIYFKGRWARQFRIEQTQDAPFTVPTNRKITVAMMQQVGSFTYLDNGSFQALELPYQGGKLAMCVFLPRKVDGLAEFEKALTAEKLAEWIARLQQKTVLVALPKFKITTAFDLNRDLAEMGMPLAFGTEADFSGMNGKSKDLFLSRVVHKAVVEVNEEGTEAAAATGGGVVALSVPRPPLDFRADHPFLFLIRDTGSGAVLFMGRLENPSK